MKIIDEILTKWNYFWSGLGATSIYHRQSPSGWENLSPIPTILVGYMGADQSGKPIIWPIADNDGYFPSKHSVFAPSMPTNIIEIPNNTSIRLLDTNEIGEISIYVPKDETVTIYMSTYNMDIQGQIYAYLGTCMGEIMAISSNGMGGAIINRHAVQSVISSNR